MSEESLLEKIQRIGRKLAKKYRTNTQSLTPYEGKILMRYMTGFSWANY